MVDTLQNVCSVCDRIGLIERKENKYFVKELKTGYVVLNDFQYFYGHTLFLSKVHANELHLLKDRNLFLNEMGVVAEAVFKAFKPKKMNYELLGNMDPHLHWHLIPRYGNDPKVETAIWAIDYDVRCNEKCRLSDVELEEMKVKLLFELEKLLR